jgi:hypothetical protein
MHQNALRDPQIPLNGKTQFRRDVSSALFVIFVPVPPEPEK